MIIGGGIAGCSALYHLAEMGWTDVTLIERGELTSGSTWHAAGLCTQFHENSDLSRLLMKSVNLYRNLRNPDGMDVGFREVGSIRLATDSKRVDEFHVRSAAARAIGLEINLIGPGEVAELWPLVETGDVAAGAYIPTDGYVDPTMTTLALAQHATAAGATIRRRTPVTGISRASDGWRVETRAGSVDCETLLLTAGQWSRQVAALAGIELPVVPLQHHFVVTESLPAVRELNREPPVLRDPVGSYYVRQEGEGLLVGPFEPDALPWSVDHVPEDFEGRLLPGRLEHILPVMTKAAERVPVLMDAGLKNVINGPDGYTPDGLCLMGEVPGAPGFHVMCGFSIFGIVFGGGAGSFAAEWIAEGETSVDMSAVDVARFGPETSATDFVVTRAKEVYASEYAIGYPDHEPAAGRPLRTSPIHDLLKSRGARFGTVNGWERPLRFADGADPEDDPGTFRRRPSDALIREEARRAIEGTGLLDLASSVTLEIRGDRGAAEAKRLVGNAVPEPGFAAAANCLRPWGEVSLDLAVARPDRDAIEIVASPESEGRLRRMLGDRPGLSSRRASLLLTGTEAVAVVGELSRIDTSQSRDGQVVRAGLGTVACTIEFCRLAGYSACRISCRPECLRALYLVLVAATEVTDLGFRAASCLAIEFGVSDRTAVAMGIPAVGLNAGLRRLSLDLHGQSEAPYVGAPIAREGRIAGTVVAASSGSEDAREGSAVVIAALGPAESGGDGFTIELLGRTFEAIADPDRPIDSKMVASSLSRA